MRLERHGTVTLLVPESLAERHWLEAHADAEPWQWTGGALAVEPRLADAILEAHRGDVGE